MRNVKHAGSLRVVLDTNVLISAILFPDKKLAGIWRLLLSGGYVAILSPAIVTEMARKLRGKFYLEERTLQDTVRNLVRRAELVQPKAIPDAVPNDPDDNHIIACALEGQADLIVSGDRHLLALHEYEGIPIVRPMDFLRIVGEPSQP